MKLTKKALRNAILLIIVLGSFLRLYRIEETLMFQGDQGRDAIIVKHIIRDGDLTLLGPVTSVGNMYLGPFYYYFMAPFLWLTYPNPVGPAYGVALLSIATIVLLYHTTKKAFGEHAAIFATIMFSFNAIAISLSRFSWNPNIAPFFALATYWTCVKAVETKKYWYFLLAALTYGLLSQTHYIALLMGLVPATAVGIALLKDKKNRVEVLIYTVGSMIVYLSTWIPLIAFDLKHNYLISSAFREFISSQDEYIRPTQKIIQIIKEMQGRSFRIFAQLNQSPNGVIDRLITYSAIAGIIALFYRRPKLKKDLALIMLFAWIISGIAGTAVYSQTIFDHYLGYLLPGIAMLGGLLFSHLWKMKQVPAKIAVTTVLAIYVWVNVSHAPTFDINYSPAKHFQRLATQMSEVIPSAGKYNLALLSESKDYRGMNYRYFLETTSHPPAHFEDYQKLEHLVIIDEVNTNNPLEVGIYEIAEPGLQNIVSTTSLDNGPVIYVVGK